ncbi:MAG: penicillin V acylase-like amidase (Ntn superfamily) [Candidatus Paceibacteria bacterium]|jgi:penicillin V acylase-like amidase (Ntn superfamily)
MRFVTLGPIALLATLFAPLLASSSTSAPGSLAPCTTFCLPASEGPVFGRNYDWGIGVAHVTVNKRGLMKTALVSTPAKPARWTSKYGSITFNQYGHEFPSGGMNEAGLVVEVMWLTATRFPDTDARAGVRELSWIQYQLDNCRTVEEVLATDSTLRITPESVSTHFLVCDSAGDQATIEFLEGKMVAHHGHELPIPALTNSPYSNSMEYLETFDGFGGDRPTPRSGSSLDRFVRAACGVVEYEPSSPDKTRDYAFEILADVSQGAYTKWSIVYDIDQRIVHFRTAAAPTIKTLQMAKFDLSPATPSLILDIDSPQAGDPTELFVKYTTESNRKLVIESWKNTEFLADTPLERLNEIATYPESVVIAAGEAVGSM